MALPQTLNFLNIHPNSAFHDIFSFNQMAALSFVDIYPGHPFEWDPLWQIRSAWRPPRRRDVDASGQSNLPDVGKSVPGDNSPHFSALPHMAPNTTKRHHSQRFPVRISFLIQHRGSLHMSRK
jgi:hypothetical protein